MTSSGLSRIETIIELLTRLAAGDLDARGARSESDEDLDAVIVGINMLAEELAAHRSELEDRVASRTVELEAARLEALESARVKSEFLATMSHEIRTPMNGVIGLTNLLLETPLDDGQRQYAEGVQHAGEALLAVINDILDFSKLEAGMVDLDVDTLDPRALVEGVASLLALTSSRKRLELIAYCFPELPAGLQGDEGRLRQVLLNLASNAVKFTDAGEVVITARVVDTATDPGPILVRFQVADTGIGIPTEAQEGLFESFTQADTSTTRRFGGTGLGLAISRRLIEAMGGEIGVLSESGVGSTFWFEVPFVVPDDAPAPASVPAPDLLDGLRVLVVDDNASNRLVLESQLATWGLRPDLVERPQEAAPLMREAARAGDPYTIAVLDMCMPGMNGLQLAELISTDDQLGDTRLIMLSSSLEVDREELARVGVREWLSKPVRSSELFDRLMRLMMPRAADRGTGRVTRARELPTERLGRVLVVEDNSLNQLVAEGVVASLGYDVDLVANGAEALEAIATTWYSAVLMDCHMPVMDGFTATERVRDDEAGGERLPIIAMTAGALAEDRERCLSVGMDDFVSKPVDVEALRTALDTWARRDPAAVAEPVAAAAGENRLDDSAVIDDARLGVLRELGPDDGQGLLPAATSAFLQQWPGLLAQLRRAAATGDDHGLGQAAHQLKGAAANLGAVLVATLSGEVETAAALPDPVEEALLDRLETELGTASRVLREVAGL